MKLKNTILYSPIPGNFFAWFIGISIMSFYVNGYSDKTGLMIGGILIGSFWTINLHAYQEARRISEGKDINHIERFWSRLCIAGAASALIHMLAFNFHDFQAPSFFGWIYFGAIFWLLFDFMLNYHRGKSLLYVSSYYKSSAMDKWFSKFEPHVRCMLWLGSKILIFIGCTIMYHLALKSTQKQIQHENPPRIIIHIAPEPRPDANV